MSEEKKKNQKKRIVDVNVKHEYVGSPLTPKPTTKISEETEITLPSGEKVKAGELIGARKEAEDLQAKFDALADEEFNEEKEKTLEKLSASGKFSPEQLAKFEEEMSGSNMEIYKSLVDIDENEESRIPRQEPSGSVELPSGQAIPNFPKGERYKDERSMIRQLYWKAHYDEKATLQEKAQAKLKIDKLWHSLFEGMKATSPEKRRGVLNFVIFACPKCGYEILEKDNFVCPNPDCSYIVPKNLRKGMRKTGEDVRLVW